MTKFAVHSIEGAPLASRPLLEKAKAKTGMVVNLLGIMAESPATLRGYMALGEAFAESSLTAVEQQVLLLTVSRENGCEYCMAAYSMTALRTRTPKPVVDAIRNDEPIAEPRLAALYKFCQTMVRERGWASSEDVDAFLAAGFTKAQVLEVVLAIALKTLSNYVNHIAETPLDPVLQSARWTRPAS